MLATRKAEVLAKVAELTQLANIRYNMQLPKVAVHFDLHGRAAGMACHKWGAYIMRFNVGMMEGDGWDHLINDTVPHELAHIVCFVNPRLGRAHDLGWKSVCVTLGGNGKRCHDEAVVYAKGRTYAYTSSTGHVIHLSEQRHSRVQRGGNLCYRGGKGTVNKQCAYEIVGVNGRVVKPNAGAAPTAVVAPVAQPVALPKVAIPKSVPVAKLDAGASNADKVRAQIRAVKQAGQDQEVVIQWAQIVLQMKRTLARAYVVNNWNKV